MSEADATVDLQKAVLDRLKAHSGVAAIVAARVYSRPPVNAAKPYVSLGPIQVLSEHAEEYVGSDTYIQIDGWSAGPEPAQVMLLGRAIRAALDEYALPLANDQRLVSLKVEDTRYLTDPDGITQHAVLTFRARTEPAQ